MPSLHLSLQKSKLLQLVRSQHLVQSLWVVLAAREQLLGHHDRNLLHQRVLSQQIGLTVEGVHSPVQRLLVGNRQLLPGLHFGLYFVLQLGHVEHELVYLGGPHGELLSLESLLVLQHFSLDPLLGLDVGDFAEFAEEDLLVVPHFGISEVLGHSVSFLVLLLHASQHRKHLGEGLDSDPHLDEPVELAVVLLLQSLLQHHLSLLLLNGLYELVDVLLLLIRIHLEVHAELAPVLLHHGPVVL